MSEADVAKQTQQVKIRSAVPKDVKRILELVQPLAERRILLGKERVTLYESIQEFWVAEAAGSIIACGALHVMWEDLAEIRTLVVAPEFLGQGVGKQLVLQLLQRAEQLEIERVFCLTFETGFFGSLGFEEIKEQAVDPETFAELLRSADDGVAEFLDLASVKPNTLGNTRMIKYLN